MSGFPRNPVRVLGQHHIYTARFDKVAQAVQTGSV
jgi:hypothetical protein